MVTVLILRDYVADLVHSHFTYQWHHWDYQGLFANQMVTGQDPNTVLCLELAKLRQFLREALVAMGLTPA